MSAFPGLGARAGRARVAASTSGEFSDAQRWIESSFASAMRRAMFVGLMVVVLILMIAALASEINVPTVAVVLVASLVIVAGIGVLFLRAPSYLLSVSYFAALIFYYSAAVATDDILLGLLIPFTAWTIVLPIVLRPGVWPIVTASLLGGLYAGIILLGHPSWDIQVLKVSLSTNVIMVVAAAAFLSFLRRIAASFDRKKEQAVQEQVRAVRARVLSSTTAEYIRVLHDTVVNTLGALARDESHRIHVHEARQRCRRDLERIRAFQNHDDQRRLRPTLTDLDFVGLPVRWLATSREDIERFQQSLPRDVLNALYWCATEGILNSTKHSGADHVTCEVRITPHELLLVIADEGRGFDTSRITERGIRDSVFARAHAHGIEVALQSEPGKGTTLRLAYPFGRSTSLPPRAEPAEEAEPVRVFEVRMAMAWTALACGSGLLVEALGRHGSAGRVYLLFAMLGGLAGAVWIAWRRRRQTSGWLVGVLLIAIPISNWCALTAIDPGPGEPYLLQARALTVLPVLVYALTPSLAAFGVAVGIQLVSMVTIVRIATGSVAWGWGEIILLTSPVLAQLAAYLAFLLLFRAIGSALADARYDTERAMRESAAREADEQVRRQWSASTLRTPFQLLQEIADGTVSPADPETRRRCEAEEAYLREVSALPREATLMSLWFALALAEARSRSVKLQLQAERAQIDNAVHADALGRLILDCVAATPEGAELTTTIVHRGGIPHLLIVGSANSRLVQRVRAYDGEVVRIRCEELAGQTLVEATPMRSHHPSR